MVCGARGLRVAGGRGYAEYVAVPAGQVLPIPSGVDLVDAAGLPEVACTVWSNVVLIAGLSRGQLLLAHGGASGIGSHAIQIARALGARVAVTAGSAGSTSAASWAPTSPSTTTTKTSSRGYRSPAVPT